MYITLQQCNNMLLLWARVRRVGWYVLSFNKLLFNLFLVRVICMLICRRKLERRLTRMERFFNSPARTDRTKQRFSHATRHARCSIFIIYTRICCRFVYAIMKMRATFYNYGHGCIAATIPFCLLNF